MTTMIPTATTTFCPDAIVWRNKTNNKGLNEMFITSRYEDNLDSVRVTMSMIPRNPVGETAMLLALDDEDNDIPIRKAAFALCSGFLGIISGPIQFTKLPVYEGLIQKQVKDLLKDRRTPECLSKYQKLKSDVLDTLPITPMNKKTTLDLQGKIANVFQVDSKNLGTIPAWVGRLIGEKEGGEDLTRRQATVSRNYYKIHQPPAVSTDSEVADVAVGPDDIDEVNIVARDCINKVKKDSTWLSAPQHRCMVLLFVITVRNANNGTAPWPNRQELMSRVISVKKLLEEVVP